MQNLRNKAADLLGSYVDKAVGEKNKAKTNARKRNEVNRLEHWKARIPRPFLEPDLDKVPSVSQQTDSKFFTLLPIELRQAIYGFALGGEELELEWIDEAARPTFAVRCSTATTLLSLPRTCHQVYAESIEYVYSHNTFVATQKACILFLQSFVAPRLYHTIRSLHVQFPVNFLYINYPRKFPPQDEATWEATWAAIADMRGLKDLRVNLLNFPVQHTDVEQAIFRPMTACRGLDNFDVIVHWDLKTKESELPFPVKQSNKFHQA